MGAMSAETMGVRVRFAPSPTGHLHVGNVRAALFNYLFARNIGGTFVLRIEDTDLERSSETSEQTIYEDMHWLGLDWDEGAGGKGGQYGPYRQTERLEIYQKLTDKLIESGDAYYCFCSNEELEAKREDAKRQGRQFIYDGKCRSISSADASKRIAAGEKPSVRFKIQKDDVVVHDIVKGDVHFPTSAFGDFIIVRPNGVPIYNYGVVVDDALMHITHVVRGDDHLSNTPKHILLFEALGYDIPKFAHIPMILGGDREKLSKRHGDTSVEQFRSKGYLPEALINFMALLSWSDGSEQEIFTIDELIQKFSFDRVSTSAAVFNFDKLKWMNGIYIRSGNIARITALAKPYLLEAGYIHDDFDNNLLEKIVASVRDNLELLADIVQYTAVYFRPMPRPDAEALEILNLPTSKGVITAFLAHLDEAPAHIDLVWYKEHIKAIGQESGAKGKALYMAVRVALTGRTKGPELDQFVPLMSVGQLKERAGITLAGLS
ncbi:glutamate--tRNA ligase [Deferribacterales bacterium RsTz2092]|nr:glutamate--tRNA ligase [Deferribacterales bacterium]